MSETQAPYLDSQNDFGEHGHFTTHSDPGDMAPATANPARLGDATLPAALLGEATERPRMMVGRFPLDHRRANVALPDDREGELLDRLAAAEARVAALEAELAMLLPVIEIAERTIDHFATYRREMGSWEVGEYFERSGKLGTELDAAVASMRAARAALDAGKEGQ